MSYSFESRVRFSEIGEDGCLTLPGVLDYFQDCCTFESEQTGVGMEVLKEQKRAWVLSAWQVIMKRYPKLGENIKVTTIPYGFRGFIGMRNFILETMDGEKLAWANSYWSFINTETGLPEKLTPADTDPYDLGEKIEMDYAPRKIALPKEREVQNAFSVQKHHLDTNHHVNNCQYIRMAADHLPEDFKVGQLRAEYKRQAVLDNVIIPEVYMTENKEELYYKQKQLSKEGIKALKDVNKTYEFYDRYREIIVSKKVAQVIRENVPDVEFYPVFKRSKGYPENV